MRNCLYFILIAAGTLGVCTSEVQAQRRQSYYYSPGYYNYSPYYSSYYYPGSYYNYYSPYLGYYSSYSSPGYAFSSPYGSVRFWPGQNQYLYGPRYSYSWRSNPVYSYSVSPYAGFNPYTYYVNPYAYYADPSAYYYGY